MNKNIYENIINKYETKFFNFIDINNYKIDRITQDLHA
jgi:hypothetical protein